MKPNRIHSLLYLVILTFSITLISPNSNFCGTNELINKLGSPKKMSFNEPTLSNLKTANAESSSSGMVFYIDYTYLNKQGSSSSSVTKIKEAFTKVTNKFSKLLSSPTKEIKISASSARSYCQVSSISSDVINGVTATIVLFPSFYSLGDGAIAAAAPCILDDSTGQPRAGVVYINTNIDYSLTNIDTFAENVLLHEISHILVFYPEMFKYFTDGDPRKTKVVNGISRTLITSSNVVKQAKKHFNCDDIEGIEVENQGGSGTAGAHWEARVMLGDYMIGQAYGEMFISDISLGLFADSGWYNVNYYTGGLFKFGKGEGCTFLEKRCLVDETSRFNNAFCDTENEEFCYAGFTATGTCYIRTYTQNLEEVYQYFSDPKKGGQYYADYCPVAYIKSDSAYYSSNCKKGTIEINSSYGEKRGNNSFCVISSLGNVTQAKKAICAEVECDYENKNVILKILNKEIKCPYQGEQNYKVDGLEGTVDCPGYNFICTSNPLVNSLDDAIEKAALKDDNTYNFDYELGDSTLKNKDDPVFDTDDGYVYRSSSSFIKGYEYLLLISLLLF